MCGRYAVTLPPEAMRDLFGYLNSVDYPPRYNIAPTQPILAVMEGEGGRVARFLRWGLVPYWVEDPKNFRLIINARREGITTRPAFRDAMRTKRCVVPADGYYEWMVGPDGRKLPFYITRIDGQPMAFAGLYARWRGPEGEPIESAAICTTPSGPDTAHIHDRQPAILEDEAIEEWLNVGAVGPARAEKLLTSPPAGRVRAQTVSSRVNSSVNDGPDLIAPLVETDEATPDEQPRRASGQLELF